MNSSSNFTTAIKTPFKIDYQNNQNKLLSNEKIIRREE
jgi:hypothetical protein